MVAVRRYLVFLIAFGLAFSPVSGVIANSIVTNDAPVSMSMEDCHHGQTEPASNEAKQNKKQCPGCDHDGPCTIGDCMMACLQHFVIVGELSGFVPTSSAHIKPTLGLMRTGRAIQPQPPPPRS